MSNDRAVTVRLFARAKDLAGAETLTVKVPDGAKIRELRSRIGAACPKLLPLLKHCALAVNEEFVGDDDALSPSQGEVVLLPPVSGG